MPELMDKILSYEKIHLAKKRVYANKGAGGVDGVTVEELDEYLTQNWKSIRAQIQARTYKPQLVKRIETPKPNGGVRKLGIPTVIDRTIEQAITQIYMTLQRIKANLTPPAIDSLDNTQRFSEKGFLSNRNKKTAHCFGKGGSV